MCSIGSIMTNASAHLLLVRSLYYFQNVMQSPFNDCFPYLYQLWMSGWCVVLTAIQTSHSHLIMHLMFLMSLDGGCSFLLGMCITLKSSGCSLRTHCSVLVEGLDYGLNIVPSILVCDQIKLSPKSQGFTFFMAIFAFSKPAIHRACIHLSSLVLNKRSS